MSFSLLLVTRFPLTKEQASNMKSIFLFYYRFLTVYRLSFPKKSDFCVYREFGATIFHIF
jgi:hypothetical protein